MIAVAARILGVFFRVVDGDPMNFVTLKKRIARRLNKNDTTLDTLTNQRLADFLNEAHRALLSDVGIGQLRDDTITFATVNAQARYALPEQGVAKINRIWDTANDRRLFRATVAWLRDIDPNPDTGAPTHWVPLSYTQVATQPVDASEVFVKSSAAGDTTQTCYVEGIITGGYRRTASVVLTGTTAVTLGATITNFIQIDKCYLSAVAVGIVTLQEDSGAGAELARIAIGDTYAKYHTVLLYPTPTSALTLTCDITRGIGDMTNDTDEPLLPEDFHDLLLEMAELKELEKGGDPLRHKLVSERTHDRTVSLRAWLFLPAEQDATDASNKGVNLSVSFPMGKDTTA